MITNAINFDLKLPALEMVGFQITKSINHLIEVSNFNDLSDLFPFRNSWELVYYSNDHLVIAKISNRLDSGMPTVGVLKKEDLDYLDARITLAPGEKSYLNLCSLLGKKWVSSNTFTFIGAYRNLHISSYELLSQLTEWLNHYVITEVLAKNRARIARVIPNPPQYDINTVKKIQDAIWILECEDAVIQGTAFYLNDTGFVTCQHVLGKNTKAFHPKDLSSKFSISILSQNKDIDLALIQIKDIDSTGLSIGSANNLNLMEHILIAGYPNYRFGDTGTITPGFVIGFRPISGIRRILTNAPIIAGSSGGPVINSSNQVIGIAVTGAEMMSKAQETENHGIIPIDALKYL